MLPNNIDNKDARPLPVDPDAFLTCEPNAVVAPIHPKAMPVILHREDEAQ